MKSRLSSTIWMLIFANVVGFGVAVWFAYSAGKQAGAGSPDMTGMIIAIVGAVAATAATMAMTMPVVSGVPAPVCLPAL